MKHRMHSQARPLSALEFRSDNGFFRTREAGA